jgi:predicted RNA-binding Zn ribbon-like protein
VGTVTVPLLGTDHTSHAVGGRLCLSFVNTLWWRRSAEPIEQLHTYADLVAAAARAGWIPDRSALQTRAEGQPARAARALRQAISLREAMAAVFAAAAAGERPEDGQIEHIRTFAAPGLASLELTARTAGPYALGWTGSSLDLPAQQVAVSAVLLLASDDVRRVKQCQGPTCGWVFVDDSRNQSRRWCDSRECGNRERVRAHYARTHA